MKKLFKAFLLIAVVACCAVAIAFAGCGDSNKGETYTGEYHYTSNSSEYGIKVAVTVEDGKITKVVKVDSDYVECTRVIEGTPWDQTKVDNWNNNLASLLAKYEGKTVAEIKAINVETKDSGEPSSEASALSGLVITDATQGSARLLLAVQNALKDVA